jgi:hypothetical protein
MTHDVIDRLVRPANPVPDPKMLEVDEVSTLPVQWREEMQQQQVAVDEVREERSRGPLVGIAAAVAVLVFGGLALVQWTDGPDSVAADRTPLEIATDYVEAYAAFDVDTVASMLAEDADVLPWESYARDWQADLRYLEAAGFQLVFEECTDLSQAPDRASFQCEYDAHGLGSDGIGLEPFGPHVFRLSIEDGQVIYSNMGFDFSEFSQAMWFPFQAWIQEEHPEDFSVMYVDESLSRQTDDAVALWEQRVPEYIEYVNDQS